MIIKNYFYYVLSGVIFEFLVKKKVLCNMDIVYLVFFFKILVGLVEVVWVIWVLGC